MSIDTSVGRVEGVRVSIDTSVQVSGQGSASPAPKVTGMLFPPHSERSGNAFWPPAFGTFPERPERGPPGDLEARARSRRGTVCTSQMNNNK